MLKDFRLHGEIDSIEYIALIRGMEAYNTCFFEEKEDGIRFFSRGNEFRIARDYVFYKGAGGSFCQYMFGVEKPFKDASKPDVLNRLIMFGAYLDEKDNLIFTNDTEGSESIERLFISGHAVKNYYFLVSSDLRGPIKERQAEILRRTGKFLKRTELISEDRDEELLHEFARALGEENATIFIFKLINRSNQEFYKTFEKLYARNKTLNEYDELYLQDLASKLNLNSYQIERIKIDVMYRHPENRRIVDEYRDILLEVMESEKMETEEIARLKRLRTLAIRNNIPVILFDTLDEMLLRGRKLTEIEEPEYIKEARIIIENLFFKDPSLKRHIIKEDIIRLLLARHRAHQLGDLSFENILLDAGRRCDEICKETGDFSTMEELGSIITFFDRYDNTYGLLSRIAFTDNMEFTEDSMRSLIGNKQAFEELEPGLWKRLFIDEFLKNNYVTYYGKKKLLAINEGIDEIVNGNATIKDVVATVRFISDEALLYRHVYSALKENLRALYPLLDQKEGRDQILQIIATELASKGIAVRVPETLFEKVLLDLKKESFYINNLLPEIIRTGNLSLREDFLLNSGFDRFHLENIESQYLTENGYPPDLTRLLCPIGDLKMTTN
ncbi:MAG: TIGR04442 family protein [Thermodesulfovibrionales bacterium]|nr:TIGR04442 family protein [Thermodesulfovibrionales bacterium]